MAINKNHEFEELDGIKCGIVEKNVTAGRADFLRAILEYNGYTVMVVPSPPPKAATGTDEMTEKLLNNQEKFVKSKKKSKKK